MRNHEYFFKKDKKPAIDLTYKVLDQVFIVGDILVPVLKSKIIDEVRFYNKEISFIKDGKITHYKYNEVKAEISHSKERSKRIAPSIKVKFIGDDGKVFDLDLTEKSNTIVRSRFSTQHRDFLYQVASRLPRLKETTFKPRNLFLEVCCAAMLLVIVLAG
jgi:hypothetical protein